MDEHAERRVIMFSTTPLASLGADERDRIERSETRLLDYLGRLVGRGVWPPAGLN